jgi:hypothetical protein
MKDLILDYIERNGHGSLSWLPPLPDYTPNVAWIVAPEDYTPAKYVSVHPPIVRLSDGTTVVDQVQYSDHYKVAIFDNKDHKNILSLPDDIPKSVRVLYTRSKQLYYVRRTSFTIEDQRELDKAYNAWFTYWKKRLNK